MSKKFPDHENGSAPAIAANHRFSRGRYRLQLANLFQELGASAIEFGSVRLQAAQDCQVSVIDDGFAQSLYISATSLIPTLTVGLSNSDDGNQHQARR